MATEAYPGEQYKLRCELRGHTGEVCCICICDKKIATSSRDQTIMVWSEASDDEPGYTCTKKLSLNSSYAGSIVWIPADSLYPQGLIVAGNSDHTLSVWDVSNEQIIHSLKGHSKPVTGVVLAGEDIVSCSADGTLKRWRDGLLVESWDAHQFPILALTKLQSGLIVSASSDGTIKFWDGKKLIDSLETDAITGLAGMPDSQEGFVSSSQDGTIRSWTPNSTIRSWTPSGMICFSASCHTSTVYSIDANLSGLIVSGSEDRFAKIWKGELCVQSLQHPDRVSHVRFAEDGAVVTACADVVRVWTKDIPTTTSTSGSVEAILAVSAQIFQLRKDVGFLERYRRQIPYAMDVLNQKCKALELELLASRKQKTVKTGRLIWNDELKADFESAIQELQPSLRTAQNVYDILKGKYPFLTVPEKLKKAVGNWNKRRAAEETGNNTHPAGKSVDEQRAVEETDTSSVDGDASPLREYRA